MWSAQNSRQRRCTVSQPHIAKPSPLESRIKPAHSFSRGVVETNLAPASAGRDAFLATTALGRIGQPEEIAKTILFLLSDESSFITASLSLHRPFLRRAPADTCIGRECRRWLLLALHMPQGPGIFIVADAAQGRSEAEILSAESCCRVRFLRLSVKMQSFCHHTFPKASELQATATPADCGPNPSLRCASIPNSLHFD